MATPVLRHYAISQPEHVAVNEILLRPADQTA
jgi:NADP-dependent 3-hydroxy acid dehydrogenase YdfG